MNSNEEFLKFMKSKDPFTIEKISKMVSAMRWDTGFKGTGTMWSPTGRITVNPWDLLDEKEKMHKVGTILTAGTKGKGIHEAVERMSAARKQQQENYNLYGGRTQSLMDETKPFVPSYNKKLKSGPGLYEFLDSSNVKPYAPSASSLASFSSFIMDW